jgi:3-hydroxyisobutyrate dehydrogenase-like beta-hydroxyacid dehydrogenase
MIVGLLHPGRMGAALGALLTAAGHEVRWCPDGRSAGTAARAEAAGLTPVPLPELLAAPVVLSVCPPAAATDVATQVAGYTGIYVEANAISPHRTVAIADLLTTATVVDGGIIGPPPQDGATARLYLSGPAAALTQVASLFAGTAATPIEIGPEPGKASALKMAYGSFTKTSQALAAVSHALAADHGVTEHLLAEAQDLGRPALASPGQLPSAAARAWRWSPEMREVADALRARSLPADLAEAAAAVLTRWSADRDDFSLDLDTTLTHLHESPQE